MYPSAPPDAYNKFTTGAPPTAPPPAAYQQHGANMNPSRPGGALRTWSTGLFHCMDDPGNCKPPSLFFFFFRVQSNGCHAMATEALVTY